MKLKNKIQLQFDKKFKYNKNKEIVKRSYSCDQNKINNSEVVVAINDDKKFNYSKIEIDEFKKVVNNHPDIGLIINENGLICYSNEHFLRKLQQHPNEANNKLSLRAVINPDYHDIQDKELSKFEKTINDSNNILKSKILGTVTELPFEVCVLDKNMKDFKMFITFEQLKQNQSTSKSARKHSLNSNYSELNSMRTTSLNSMQKNESLYLVKMITNEEMQGQQIIIPKSVQQICWTLIMFVIIVQIIWSFTFEQSYSQDIFDNQNDRESFDYYVSILLTLFFSVDLIQNFFLAQEEVQGQELDHCKIVINQLSTFFIFDLVSTIPFDQIQVKIDSKNIRVVKIVKVIKLLRLAKLQSIFNFNTINTNEVIQELQLFLKKNQGFLELLKIMLILFIITHFQSCIYFMIKMNSMPEPSIDWLESFGNQNPRGKSAFDIQFKVFAECLKLSLGVTEFETSNTLEIMMEILWLIFGLSIFGQGIGNISAQLNQANKWENDYNEKLNQFKELMSMHNNESLHELITRDLDKYYKNILINEFDHQSNIMSNNVKNMLETTIYKEFMNSHQVLAKLNIKAIRLLKYSKINSDYYIVRPGQKLYNVQFVINGSIKMLNTNLSVLNEQKQGEIIGIPQFKEQFMHKYLVDLSSLEDASNVNNQNNLEKYVKDKLLKKFREKEKNFNFVNRKIELEADWYAISSTIDTSQYEVDYDTLEELFRIDIDSLKTILDQSVTQLQLITESDRETYESKQSEFDKNDSCGIMIQENGEFEDINQELYYHPKFAILKDQWLEFNLQEIMKDEDGNQIHSQDDIIQNQNQILDVAADQKQKIKVSRITDAKLMQNQKNDIYYYKLKKSMLDVKIIYFNVE